MTKDNKKSENSKPIPLVQGFTGVEEGISSGHHTQPPEDTELIQDLENSIQHTVDSVLSSIQTNSKEPVKEPDSQKAPSPKKAVSNEPSEAINNQQELPEEESPEPLSEEPTEKLSEASVKNSEWPKDKELVFNIQASKQASHDSQNNQNKDTSNPTLDLNLSHHLKIAENKIQELTDQCSELKIENQKLTVEAESLQENLERISNESKIAKSNYQEKQFQQEEKNEVLETALEDQKIEFKNLQARYKALEKHLKQGDKNIHTRERELENKLAIKQNELSAIVREKDQHLLQLQKEMDYLKDKFKSKTEEVQKLKEEKVEEKEKAFRVIRTLQMSLGLLKGGEVYTGAVEQKSDKENQPKKSKPSSDTINEFLSEESGESEENKESSHHDEVEDKKSA